MRILAVDVGTGTQDILLFDSDLQPENCFKLVLPSPTMMVARKVKAATMRQQPLLLTGLMMGGGPSHWAVRDHASAGNPVYATPDAALTFDDDSDKVRKMGIQLVDERVAERLAAKEGDLLHIQLRDFDYPALVETLARFGVDTDFDGIAVAVFDHGAAPPDVSDRQFRFDYLDRRIRAENRLSAFAYSRDNIPAEMTRLQAVASSAQEGGTGDARLLVMDTAPAAVSGALSDPAVIKSGARIIANVGNFHTLAFRLGKGGIEGLFEHHTGEIDITKLDHLLGALAASTLRHEDVFGDAGHGALIYNPEPSPIGTIAVTGPRRAMLEGSRHSVYFAVPYGDMMIAGCWGMVRAWGDLYPEDEPAISAALRKASAVAPWELL